MTIDELIKENCPEGIDYESFRQGFLTGTKWWFEHEKIRHQEDIDHIKVDLMGLSFRGIKVVKIDEYIEI